MSTHDVISSLAAAEAAQIHVERAKLSVEHARGLLEAARVLEAEAKGKLEEAYAQAETLGISRKAFKEVVAERVAALIGSGLLSLTPLSADEEKPGVQGAAEPSRPRAVRTRKVAEATPDVVHPEAGLELSQVTHQEAAHGEPDVAAAQAVEPSPEAAQPEPEPTTEAVAEPAPEAAAVEEQAPEVAPEPAPEPAPAPVPEAPKPVARPPTPSFLARGARPSGAPSNSAVPGLAGR
jgi:hypothetical protein